ncbi:hypothetical protein BG011_007469 [Mortierella polycephala]|uniref:Sphingomyelin phosphodiesterase n=1 Tax=Mortierella polycephala TaxID=41804 RepID=A0A9P6PQ27_9FUNG|nr:hypothetical protein BG011_007469 [Mortierella polycephala]
MRLKLSSAILSLVAATTVFAAPTPIQLDKRNWLVDQLRPLFTKAINTLECGACVAAITGAKNVALINKNWVLDAGRELCPSLAKKPADVCDGMVDLYGHVLIDVIMKANISGGDGKILCHSLGGICPAPAIKSGSVNFPKPKPANIAVPAPSGQLVDVLHLSDWHTDDLYVGGSEADCDKPTCCRKYVDSPLTPTRRASTWGDYKCDTPQKLTDDLLKFVPKVANVSFAIMTGDVPPHDIWIQNKESVDRIEKHAYGEMAALPAKIYPAVGNHESGPASPHPGFRIISLNTNFCYTVNFYLYANTAEHDPFNEIKWLVTQLQAAEDAGERVWIISHVGPSMTDCMQNWSHLYYQVIQRYSPHVIAEQFFGHSHYDEFALYYGPGAKSAQNAISTGWIGPSVTPYTDLNPGFRVYKVDSKTWNVFDSQTYIANLDQSAEWDKTGATPNWHLEYSAREAYGAYVPIEANEPLSASWWHKVTMAFEKNDAAFQMYWTFRDKSAKRSPACAAGGPCPTEMICNMRAGKSADSCTDISIGNHRRDLEEEVQARALADATDPSGMRSLYKRAEPQPWNKKLCGLPFGF